MFILRLLGYLWALPHSLFGLLLLAYYWPRSVRWSEGALDVITTRTLIGGRWVAGQTYGWVIFYREGPAARGVNMRAHEREHVRQALIGGPFYPLAYGLHFLWLWLVKRENWRDAYRANWFEVRAYAVGDQATEVALPKATALKPN